MKKMNRYRCLTDNYGKKDGYPVKGEIYLGSYSWGSKVYTVEELSVKEQDYWELVEKIEQIKGKPTALDLLFYLTEKERELKQKKK